MTSVQVCIKSIEFDKSISNSDTTIWGEMYIRIGKLFFPDDSWYDAVSSLLDMWTVEIIEMICNQKTKCYLFFMDGPFLVELTSLSATCVSISCKERDGAEFANHIVNLYELAQSILDCACFFLESCQEKSPYFTDGRIGQKIAHSCNKLREILRKRDGSS